MHNILTRNGWRTLRNSTSGSTSTRNDTVIPRRSRTWTDICNNGEYCHGYTKPEPKEIAESIRRALEKPLTAPIEHLKKFTPEKITEKILKVVDETLKEG